MHSAVKALEAAGADVELTGDRRRAQQADGLLVPGVGAFGAVMAALRASHGDEIIDRRLAGGRPVLGICVGMQVLFDARSRAAARQPRGSVSGRDGSTWLHAPTSSRTWAGTRWMRRRTPRCSPGSSDERFYFVHSYAVQDWTLDVSAPFPQPRVTWAEHGTRFVAAVENGPLSATQFHPEKSGAAGIQLLRNWLSTL